MALLIEPHEPSRVQAQRLLLKAGLEVKAVATVDQAQAARVHGEPDSVVTGVETLDPALALLLPAPTLRVLPPWGFRR